MKHGSNQRRARSRGQGRKNPKNQTYESNHPEIKVRGTAQQVFDKYMALARDASSAGDRITAESYFQFAEHYFRIISANNADARPNNKPQRPAEGGDEEVAVEQIEISSGETSVDPDGPQPDVEVAEDEGERKPQRRSRTPRRSRTQRAADHAAAEADDRNDGASIASALPEAVLPKAEIEVVKPEVVAEAAEKDDDETEPLTA